MSFKVEGQTIETVLLLLESLLLTFFASSTIMNPGLPIEALVDIAIKTTSDQIDRLWIVVAKLDPGLVRLCLYYLLCVCAPTIAKSIRKYML